MKFSKILTELEVLPDVRNYFLSAICQDLLTSPDCPSQLRDFLETVKDAADRSSNNELEELVTLLIEHDFVYDFAHYLPAYSLESDSSESSDLCSNTHSFGNTLVFGIDLESFLRRAGTHLPNGQLKSPAQLTHELLAEARNQGFTVVKVECCTMNFTKEQRADMYVMLRDNSPVDIPYLPFDTSTQVSLKLTSYSGKTYIDHSGDLLYTKVPPVNKLCNNQIFMLANSTKLIVHSVTSAKISISLCDSLHNLKRRLELSQEIEIGYEVQGNGKLPSSELGRPHARLVKTQSGWDLHDYDSLHGTWQLQRGHRPLLTSGETFKIKSTQFRFAVERR